MNASNPAPTTPSPADTLIFALYLSYLQRSPFSPARIGDYDYLNDCVIESEQDYCRFIRSVATNEFFSPSSDYIPPTLAQLLISLFSLFSSLNNEGQKHLIEYADTLLSSGKYNRQ